MQVGDTQVSALNDRRRRDFRIRNLGLVFQDFELLDYLNVLDDILHPYRITRALRLDVVVRERLVPGEAAESRANRQRLNESVGRLEISMASSATLNPPYGTPALADTFDNNCLTYFRELSEIIMT